MNLENKDIRLLAKFIDKKATYFMGKCLIINRMGCNHLEATTTYSDLEVLALVLSKLCRIGVFESLDHERAIYRLCVEPVNKRYIKDTFSSEDNIISIALEVASDLFEY